MAVWLVALTVASWAVLTELTMVEMTGQRKVDWMAASSDSTKVGSLVDHWEQLRVKTLVE